MWISVVRPSSDCRRRVTCSTCASENPSISTTRLANVVDRSHFRSASSAARCSRTAHQLQLHERLTHQIADEIQRVTGSNDVMVVGKGHHLCMSMRGIKTPAVMSNSVVSGRFRELAALRAEALSLMGL